MASSSDRSRTRYWMLLIISASVIPVLLISTIILGPGLLSLPVICLIMLLAG